VPLDRQHQRTKIHELIASNLMLRSLRADRIISIVLSALCPPSQ
jgi:hypothetical protein